MITTAEGEQIDVDASLEGPTVVDEFQVDLSELTPEFAVQIEDELYTIRPAGDVPRQFPPELLTYNSASLDLIYGMLWLQPDKLKAVSVDEVRTRERIMMNDFDEFMTASRAFEMHIENGDSNLDDCLTAVRDQRRSMKEKIAKGRTVAERAARVYKEWKEARMVHRPTGNAETATQMILKLPIDPGAITNTWGEFDGNPLKWHGFLSAFVAGVHGRNDVPPVSKFKHLMKALKGKAATALGTWDVTDENYRFAWLRLLELYDKKYPRIQAYISEIVNLPTLHETTADGLQKLGHTTYEVIRQLKNLGLPTDSWDMMIVCMLHAKLDPQTRCEWELARNNDDNPKLEFMLNFLERRATAYTNVPRQLNNQSANANRNMTAQRSSYQPVQQNVSQSTSTATQDSGARKKQHFCHDCKQVHQVYQCPKFAALSMVDRSKYVERYKLCPNCLRVGHSIDSCDYKGCFKCVGAPKHNQLLCPIREMAKGIAGVHNAQSKGQGRSSDNNK